jgi:signal transduction histidine kinase
VCLRSTVVSSDAVIEIEDTGIGIADEDLPRIFDRFFRADRARSREVPGSGLGLSIARWIAETHQGRIEVESLLGAGSTFRIVLPLVSPETSAIEAGVPLLDSEAVIP